MPSLTGHRSKPMLRLLLADVGEPTRGTVIAEKYTIQRLLARGGMGDIYLATQAMEGSCERPVVVKLLSERWLSDADAVARFEREAMRIRALEHSNIVEIFDSGIDRGRPFIVMEHISGEPLSEYLARRGPLTMQEFVPIAAQVLKGINHAHMRDMMIRDIKPENIMLCERKGRANFVKILDFGLAKFTRNEAPLTEGYVLGTAGYLAPEAIKGEPLTLQVDVYSIGVLFYHLLSGHLPFEGQENATVFYKTINEPPRRLVDHLPVGHDVPEELLVLVSDCLEKDPNKRPADASVVVERLIDAVPAAYFKLPRARATAGPSTNYGPAHSSSTGLIEFEGFARPKHSSSTGLDSVPAVVVKRPAVANRTRVAMAVAFVLAALVVGAAERVAVQTTAPIAEGNVVPPAADSVVPPTDDDATLVSLFHPVATPEVCPPESAEALLAAPSPLPVPEANDLDPADLTPAAIVHDPDALPPPPSQVARRSIRRKPSRAPSVEVPNVAMLPMAPMASELPSVVREPSVTHSPIAHAPIVRRSVFLSAEQSDEHPNGSEPLIRLE